jgi:hypothetical protein
MVNPEGTKAHFLTSLHTSSKWVCREDHWQTQNNFGVVESGQRLGTKASASMHRIK